MVERDLELGLLQTLVAVRESLLANHSVVVGPRATRQESARARKIDPERRARRMRMRPHSMATATWEASSRPRPLVAYRGAGAQ